MKLCLQSKHNYKNTHEKREEIIYKESLHINDELSYERFLELFEKYGEGLEEREFAKYCLDIPTRKYYDFQKGKCKSASILCKEWISEEDIESIIDRVRYICKSQQIVKINYDTIENLHKKIGGKLDFITFAEETFGIKKELLAKLKSKREQGLETNIVTKDNKVARSEIKKIQADMIKHAKLHMNDDITLSQFQELYKTYGHRIRGKDFCLSSFANRVTSILSFKRKEVKEYYYFI